ncbi:MAG: helix-turn-helix domain-containing protein, partial [Eubacteriales bacterium]
MAATIAEKICTLRKAKNLTQEALGATLGITGQAVSKWEKGDSMPDILILPELCPTLDVSAEYLLGMTEEEKRGDIVQDFCAYARQNGRNAAILDVISRLFNDAGSKHRGDAIHVSLNGTRVYMEGGIGFVAQEYRERLNELDQETTAYFLRILADEPCLKILFCMSMGHAVTQEEIAEKTGLEKETLARVLLGLMKRNILCCEKDNDGKR